MKFRIDHLVEDISCTRVTIAVWSDPNTKLVSGWVVGKGHGLKAALIAASVELSKAGMKISARTLYKGVPAYFRHKAEQERLQELWCY